MLMKFQPQSGQLMPKFFQQFVIEILSAAIFEKDWGHKGLTVKRSRIVG